MPKLWKKRYFFEKKSICVKKNYFIGMVTKEEDFILFSEPGSYADYKAKLG